MKPKSKTEAKLYAIRKCETDGSNILKNDVHRKLFSDCVFKVLKYPVGLTSHATVRSGFKNSKLEFEA